MKPEVNRHLKQKKKATYLLTGMMIDLIWHNIVLQSDNGYPIICNYCVIVPMVEHGCWLWFVQMLEKVAVRNEHQRKCLFSSKWSVEYRFAEFVLICQRFYCQSQSQSQSQFSVQYLDDYYYHLIKPDDFTDEHLIQSNKHFDIKTKNHS